MAPATNLQCGHLLLIITVTTSMHRPPAPTNDGTGLKAAVGFICGTATKSGGVHAVAMTRPEFGLNTDSQKLPRNAEKLGYISVVARMGPGLGLHTVPTNCLEMSKNQAVSLSGQDASLTWLVHRAQKLLEIT
ncbi:Hypothetical predicted protein [Olea europaea subsp. europaea]|uniref:Uncharacterized protein n=1 Tax=Olea europaea subsp. europaea TaxID=158383 RepID=A0A8S0PN94_OLEEU|nr:Hypothetical predicted protein [Olea europaea subsp. europaea]